ncbi:MAG: DUF2141 domain-containing protein [Pseudomonadota bacterium]
MALKRAAKPRWRHYQHSVLCALALATGSAWGESLTINLANVASSKGNVMVRVFADPDAFPMKPEQQLISQIVPADKGEMQISFRALAPGTYAVAVAHDENGNGELDFNFIGIPKEPYGFSNNAKGTMGPPKFSKAQFAHGNAPTEISITMKN